jgi:hypothetical protein
MMLKKKCISLYACTVGNLGVFLQMPVDRFSLHLHFKIGGDKTLVLKGVNTFADARKSHFIIPTFRMSLSVDTLHGT